MYMILTWVGIVTMVVVLAAWVLYENRRLIGRGGSSGGGHPEAFSWPPTPQEPPPQPGMEESDR